MNAPSRALTEESNYSPVFMSFREGLRWLYLHFTVDFGTSRFENAIYRSWVLEGIQATCVFSSLLSYHYTKPLERLAKMQ